MKLIQQGAEAKIILEKDKIIKDRISKSYRLKQLDDKIRKQRTKSETKLLEKASEIINSPKPENSKDNFKIIMPYINGKKLSEHLDNLKNAEKICKQIGEAIAKLHDAGIIHGDLTTSNILLKDDKIYIIDFGLGYHSDKSEDKAVDLHLIKQAFEAKHFNNYKKFWKAVESGYKISKNYDKVMERLKKVESRGRYKERY